MKGTATPLGAVFSLEETKRAVARVAEAIGSCIAELRHLQGFVVDNVALVNRLRRRTISRNHGLHEVVLGTTGRKQGTSSKAAHLPSTESLLCKRRLLEAFLSHEHPLVGQLKSEELSYHAIKDMADEYHHMLEHLRKAPFFGCWRAKPTFVDSFTVLR